MTSATIKTTLDAWTSTVQLHLQPFVRRPVLILLGLLAMALSPSSALAAPHIEWSSAQLVDNQPPFQNPARLNGISCPSAVLCVAVDDFGHAYSSTNPTSGSAAWNRARVRNVNDSNGFDGISCPSTSLCVAVDRSGAVSTSTDPTGAASAWKTSYVEESFGLGSVSCPSVNLCVATNGHGIATSTNPTGGTAAWTAVGLNSPNYLESVSCPSTGLCIAVGESGSIYTSTNPTGGAGAWTLVDLGSSLLYAVSCSSTSLCVIGTNDGIFTSTNPTGGSGAWTAASTGSIQELSCAPSTTLCVGASGEEIRTSTNPTGGAGAWTSFIKVGSGAIRGFSCPTSNFCAGVDHTGNALTSTNPTGGAAAWAAAHIEDFGSSVITAASCPSEVFCVIGDGMGRLFTSTNPTGGPSAWHPIALDQSFVFGVSCPSPSFCAAVQAGKVWTSTNPTGGVGAWHSAELISGFGGPLLGISCSSASMCVAVTVEGQIASSDEPTGEASAWSIESVDPRPASWNTYGGSRVSCPSSSFCAAVDISGKVLTSVNPTGGAAAWSVTTVDPSAGTEGFNSVSCPSTLLCVAVAPYPTFDLATTTNPLGGAAAWNLSTLSAIGGLAVSCPTIGFCAASGYINGSIGEGGIEISTNTAATANPTAGPWGASVAEGGFTEYVPAISCPTASFCVAGDAGGNIFTGGPAEGGKGNEEELPETCATDPSLCPQQSAAQTPAVTPGPTPKPGVGIAAKTGTIKGNFALVQSRCVGESACKGIAKLLAKAAAVASSRQSRKAGGLVIGSGRFTIAPGKSGTIRIKLTAVGKQLARKAGRAGLRARLVGSGLRGRTVILKPQTASGKKRQASAQISASTLKEECVRVGTASPKDIEALLRHPGDKKTQSASLAAVWAAMPEDCDGSFARVAAVRFEIQNPLNLRQWVRMGGWTTPVRDPDDIEKELEEEREAEGKSCYREGPAGKEWICHYKTTRLTNKGGEASAYSDESRAKEYPYHIVEKQRYRCAPGKAVTHVRAHIRSRVIESETKRVVAQAVKTIGVEVVRARYVTGEPKRRGRVKGPC